MFGRLTLLFVFLSVLVQAQKESEIGFLAQQQFRAIEVEKAIFSEGVTMTDLEKDLYAEYVVEYAADQLQGGAISEEMLELARKCVLLAKNLSPKNKQAEKLRSNLAKGQAVALFSEFKGEALTSLLISRAELLKKEEGEKNQKLARAMVILAGAISPNHLLVIKEEEERKEGSEPLSWDQLF